MENSTPGTAEEAEWVRQCQRGNREAFTKLVERYQRRIFGLVFHFIHQRDEVEDLAQEIFIKAFLGIRSYNFLSSFATWLSRIAVNHCYDYLRRQRVSRVSYYSEMTEASARQVETLAGSPETGSSNPERQALLRDLVDKLLARAPVDDRIVLILKELEELSVEEIAEILELKSSTVKVRLHRARNRMLEDLKRLGQGR